jgi:hypothetical protein
MFLDHPEHDWASHPADAFRYLALGISDYWDGEKPKAAPKAPAYSMGGATGWMA